MADTKKMGTAGKELGHAFVTFSKTSVRSIATVIKNVDRWASEDESAEKARKANGPEKTVFNDGSWKKTGKEFGKAFTDFGDALFENKSSESSAKVVCQKCGKKCDLEDTFCKGCGEKL